MIGNMNSPQKENNDYPNESNTRNPNRQFFQKQNPNNMSSQQPPMGNRQAFGQQLSSGNRFEQQQGNAPADQQQQQQKITKESNGSQLYPQNPGKNNSQTNRKKIFASNDDALSIASIQQNGSKIGQQGQKQNQILTPQNFQNQQNYAPNNSNINQQNQNLQNFQSLTPQPQQVQQVQQVQSVQQSVVQINEQPLQQQNVFKQQKAFQKNGSDIYMNQQNNSQNITQMYSELLSQYNQLQEAKEAAEVTHNLEIEDTKKHYEFKLNEGLKKHQEILLKLQNQQQGNVHIQSQIKNLQDELKRKDEETAQYKQKLSLNAESEDEITQLRQQKAQQDKIISEGKLYIERIKAESEQKSLQINKLQEDQKEFQMKNIQLIEQLEGAKNNTVVMRSEIDQLIACNFDFQKKIEFERKEKDDKVSEYQKILSRVNHSYTTKASEEEKTRKIFDLETNLKKMIDRNTELTNELKERVGQIERYQNILKQKGIQADILSPNGKNFLYQNPNYGLQQITEEQDEESYIEFNKKSVVLNDLNTNNVEDLKFIAKQLMDDNENIKSQVMIVKNQNSVLNKEVDILRANSQLSFQGAPSSSQTYIDRIKELNNNVSQLQKDKETLIYENTVIVNQMKKERQNREEEVKLLQNQIKNYQKLSTISSQQSPPPPIQITTPVAAHHSLLSPPQGLQKLHNASTADAISENASTLSQQSSMVSVQTLPNYSSKQNSFHNKPPVNSTLVQNVASPNLTRLSDLNGNSSHSNSLQRYKQSLQSQQQQQPSIVNTSTATNSALKRTSSYDGHLPSSIGQLNHNGPTLSHQHSLSKLHSVSPVPNSKVEELDIHANKVVDFITPQFDINGYEQQQSVYPSLQNASGLHQQNQQVIYTQHHLNPHPHHQSLLQQPSARTQLEMNLKQQAQIPQQQQQQQNQQFVIPPNISYVISRPPNDFAVPQAITPSGVYSQQNEIQYQIKPAVSSMPQNLQSQQQSYAYPTQISFGEFGDVLQQFKRQDKEMDQQHIISENYAYQMPMSQM